MASLGDPVCLPVPDLRSADGWLHPAAITTALGITDLELRHEVRATRSTLPATSDAQATHPVLIGFARVIAAARLLLPDESARRDWLHCPQPRLGGLTAMERMLAGHAREVAWRLEMVLDGGGGAAQIRAV